MSIRNRTMGKRLEDNAWGRHRQDEKTRKKKRGEKQNEKGRIGKEMTNDARGGESHGE